MDCDKPLKKNKWNLLFLTGLCLAATLAGCYLLMPSDASEEYAYTVNSLFRFGFIPLLLLTAILFYLSRRGTPAACFMARNCGWFLFCFAGILLISYPVFSPWAGGAHWSLGITFSICWAMGTLCMAVGLFWLSSRFENLLAALFCLFASIFLAYFVGETAFLLTSQPRDGRWRDHAHSKYVLEGKAIEFFPVLNTKIGPMPLRPDTPEGAAVHRELRYDLELFDARYTLNAKNHRITPPANDKPLAELMIFGCSFTFGYGLNDDQTWPWLLAKELGPAWKVENYGSNGFGAQQMLAMLEENMVEKPTTPIREALFMTINGHIPRNSGLFPMDSVSYDLLGNGDLVRGKMTSESPLRAFVDWQHVLNGSQLAREISDRIVAWLTRQLRPEQTRTFVAILEKSARILRSRYGTSLTILLWPDIEDIAPLLENRGLKVLLVRNMLKDFDSAGVTAYHIVPCYEGHPNLKATTELAGALALYYRDIEKNALSSPGFPNSANGK